MLYLLLSSACDEYGLDEKYTDDLYEDSAIDIEDACELCIENVYPSAGPLSGGTSLSIVGEGFSSDTLVYFGNQEMSATFLDSNTLVITTPSSLVAGSVDITVTKGAQSHTLFDAFSYTDDSSGGNTGGNTSGNTDTGNSGNTGGNTDTGTTNNSGLISGLVELAVQGYVDPLISPSGTTPMVSGSVTLHSPTAGSWLSWLPATGTCVSTINQNPLASGDNSGSLMYLTGTAGSFSLPAQTNAQTGTSYTSNLLSVDQIAANTPYDVEIPGTGEVIQNAVSIPSDFTITPIEPFVYPELFAYPMSASNFMLSWTPFTGGEMMLILEFFSYPDGNYHSMLLCMAEDNGALGIPASMLAAFTNYSITVQLYRIQRSQALRDDGSFVEGFGMIGWTGTGYLAP